MILSRYSERVRGPRVMKIEDKVKEKIAELKASRGMCVLSVRQKARETSHFTGNEASARWITRKAARRQDCQ